MRDLLFLVTLFPSVILAINYVYVSVLFWVWAIFLDPNEYLFGFAAAIPYNKMAVVLMAMALVISKETKRFICDRSSTLALAFLIIAFISQLLSLSDNDGGWVILDKLWKIIALNLAIVSFMRTRTRIHALVLTLVLTIGFSAITAGLKFMITAGSFHIVSISNFGDNNHVGLIVAMAIPLLIYVTQVSASVYVRFSATISVIMFMICIISTNSRGAFIALLVIAIAGFINSSRRASYAASVLIVAAILSLFVTAQWSERMNTIGSADLDSSFMGRVIAWKISMLIAMDNPVIGAGLHAIQSQNIWEHYTIYFSNLDWLIPTDQPDDHFHAAHSIYFELIGDTGLLGFIVYMSIVFTTFLRANQVIAMAKGCPELFWADSLARNIRLSMAIFLVSGAALSASYHDLNFIIFGIMSALYLVVRQEREAVKMPAKR